MIRIPPFRDAHMHFTLDGLAASEEEIIEIIAAYRRSGIFTVMDMCHRSGVGLVAKKIAKGRLAVKTAGFALSKRGGYGAFLGRQVSGGEEIKAAIKELAGSGADFIKVINSGIVSVREDEPVTEGFLREELDVICAEARERSLVVACHANAERAIRDALSAGVSSVEHGFFVTDELLHMMAGTGVSWTPTVFALAVLFRNTFTPGKEVYRRGGAETSRIGFPCILHRRET